MEKTLCIIKPDAVEAGVIGKILEQIEGHELKIVAMELGQWPVGAWEKFYAEHDGKPFFNGLTHFMSSGPVVLVGLEGPNAVQNLRRLIGATKPKEAALGTLRRQFGTEGARNAVHGSDSVESGIRETEFWFNGFI